MSDNAKSPADFVIRPATEEDAGTILALIEGSVMLAKMKNDPRVLRDLKRDVLRLVGAESSTS